MKEDMITNKEIRKEPHIGMTYSIVENGKRVFGTVEMFQGDTGEFWVKWNDGETTLEKSIDGLNNNHPTT
jgi:hypothetical protein